jgi:hypothetical protein
LYREIQTSVLVDGERTRYVPSLQGVRQGCPLSPALFGLFIEELAVRLSKIEGGAAVGANLLRTLLYADDIVLIADSVEQLQEMIDVLAKYCAEWRMSVNLSKSQAMVIKAKNSFNTSIRWQWTLNGSPVKLVEEYLYLGVLFTRDLKWYSHFERVVARGRSSLNGLAQTLADKRVALEVKRTVYRSVVCSQMDYAAEICQPSTQAEVKKLEAVQHSALVSMLRLNSKTSLHAVRRAAGVLSVKSRHLVRRLRYLSRLHQMPSSRWPKRVFDHTLGESASNHLDSQETDLSSGSDDDTVMDVLEVGPFSEPEMAADWRESHRIYVQQKGSAPTSWARRMTSVEDANIFLRCAVKGDDILGDESFDEDAKSVINQVAWDLDAEALNSHSIGVRRQTAIIENTTLDCCQAPLAPVVHPRRFANLIRTKLMCGTAPLNGLVTNFVLGRDKHCPSCPNTLEDPSHFLLSCPLGEEARKRLLLDIQDACTCVPAERIPCHWFYAKLKDPQKQMCFLLGGPVGGRTIEWQVDDVSRKFVGAIWELRKKALTESLDVPMADQTSNTSSESKAASGNLSSSRIASPLRKRGMDDDDDDEDDEEIANASEASTEDYNSDVPPSEEDRSEMFLRGNQPAVPNWAIFGPVAALQSWPIFNRSSAANPSRAGRPERDLDAHVRENMQSE